MKYFYGLSAVLMVGYTSIFTLFGQIRDTFGFTETGLGIIAATAFIAGFTALTATSRFADIGLGAVSIRLGMGCAIVGTLWLCVGIQLWEWIAARFLLGFGAGCIRPTIRRYAFVVDPSRAGELLGKVSAAEIAGGLIGPVFAAVLLELFGIRAPFIAVSLLLIALGFFVLRINVPGSENPTPNAYRVLLRKPVMQSCLLLGLALSFGIGVFDAIWSLYLTDLGASSLFIGISVSAFTLPMIFIAAYSGKIAAKYDIVSFTTISLLCGTVAMYSYGLIDSYWWLTVPLIIHASLDAISIPALQLGVGKASGEGALSAGQGLVGALGLVAAAIASISAGWVYERFGSSGLWTATTSFMGLCIIAGYMRGRGEAW